jgi:hypothetical protein
MGFHAIGNEYMILQDAAPLAPSPRAAGAHGLLATPMMRD